MKKIIYLIIIVVSYNTAYSQKIDTATNLYKALNKINSLKTADSKDILSNAFQATISNLLGKSRSFGFNTTLYGIDSLLFIKARSSVDSEYTKQRILRNIQINLAVKADSTSNKLNSLSAGLVIALINKRDITYADFSKKLALLIANFERIRKEINLKTVNSDPSIYKQLEKSWTAYSISHDYNDLDPLILTELNKHNQTDQDFIKNNSLEKAFNDISALYARKPLLTVSPGYSYNGINKQSDYSISAAFLVGLSNYIDKKPWELEMRSSFSITGDSTIASPNFNNRPFSISAGLNKVLRVDDKKVSTMELKGFFQYNDQFGGAPFGADMQKITFNTTLRINVYKSFWLPLTLTYDIKHANVFGFLSFTANIDK